MVGLCYLDDILRAEIDINAGKTPKEVEEEESLKIMLWI